METKICTKCGVEKPLDDFYRCNSGQRRGACKECFKQQMKKVYSLNPQKIKAMVSAYKELNRGKVLSCLKNNYQTHREDRLSYASSESTKKRRRERENKRRKEDIRFHLYKRISRAIYLSIKRKNNKEGKWKRKWETLVDFNLNQLRIHLEKQFLPGMSWDNYGQWHIDHKFPIAVFDFTSFNDLAFKKCWSLKNLRPMWAKDNQKKSASLIQNFQLILPLKIK